MSLNHCLAVVVALVSGAFVACAPPPVAAAASTAADVAQPATGAANATEATETSDVPAGQLVCRTRSADEGTSELFLEWDGTAAKGVLRRIAPSGMVYVQRVHAERSGDVIVADIAGETDLTTHAAVVGRDNGKQHMRVGGGRAWSTCE